MISNRTLALACGVTGCALSWLVVNTQSIRQKRDAALLNRQVTRWEDEGGNLLPTAIPSVSESQH